MFECCGNNIVQHVSHCSFLMPTVTAFPPLARSESIPIGIIRVLFIPSFLGVFAIAKRVHAGVVVAGKLDPENIQEQLLIS